MTEINDVVGMQGQLSRDSVVMESGSNEDQINVRRVTCRPREKKTLKSGEDEMNEDENGVLSDVSDLSDISQVGCDKVYSLDERLFFG